MDEHPNLFDVILEKSHLGENLEGVMRSLGLASHVDMGGAHAYGEGEMRFAHVLAAVVVTGILLALAYASRSRTKHVADAIVPEATLTLPTFVELIVESTYGMMAGMMGKKAAKFFLPLIGTCAFFILFSNALGLIPGLVPATDKLNTTLVLGVIIFIATHIFGLKENGLGHVKHLFGPWLGIFGLPLNLLLFCIECISHLVRPLSLAIRLAANMMADHMVLGIFMGAGALSFFLLPLPIYVLGCLVVVVQTLVFCLLSTVYISMAIAHEEH